ncbi:fungal-specific transcription factor domain-containing protein [Astrocystis sublimbata]|nr:fungal-specific transcription factor domain-containing protein [Astrocystis sublimbata]
MDTTHQGKQQFKCPIPTCYKLFNRREHVTRHLKSHNPVAQYQCHVCGRRYARSDVLRRHISGHYPDQATPKPVASTQPEPSQVAVQYREDYQDVTMETSASTLASHNVTNDVWNPRTVPESWPPPDFPISGNNIAQTAEWATLMSAEASMEFEGISRDAIVPSAPSALTDNQEGPPSSLSSLTYESVADTASSVASNLPTNTSASSPPEIAEDDNIEEGDMVEEIDASAPETRRLVEVYFALVHPCWPVLHRPTFSIEKCSKSLLASIMMIAAHAEGNERHLGLSRSILDTIGGHELMSCPSLHLLQAILLCVAYSIRRVWEPGMATKAAHLNAILVSTCRSLGVFKDSQLYHGGADQSRLSSWIAKEQIHRLAFNVFCVDTYISGILDHPPTVRYQELRIPLPVSTELWEASDEMERRRLQWQEPAGRQRVLFSSIMRDFLEVDNPGDEAAPYRLDTTASHLGFCALRSGVWEAAEEAHSSATDELSTKYEPGSPILRWQNKVASWKRRTEDDCALSERYFASSSHPHDTTPDPAAAFSLLLGHLYHLHMHAPLRILQQVSNYSTGPDTTVTRLTEAQRRLRIWMKSPCSRITLHHAAQISRVAVEELKRSEVTTIPQNPLVIPALLTSAQTAWAIAHLTSTCDHDRDHNHDDGCSMNERRVLDIFDVADECDAKLAGWGQHGGPVAFSWGPTGPVVCRCQSRELASWFRVHLSKEASAEAEFVAIVNGVQAASM